MEFYRKHDYMKRAFFLSILSAICFSASAQFHTGEKLIGANMHYYHTSTISETPNWRSLLRNSATSLHLLPYFGMFVNDKLFFGVGVGYYLEKEASQDTPDATALTRSKLYTMNFLLRRYHFFFDKFGIFGQGLIGGGFGNIQGGIDDYDSYESALSSLQVTASLGLIYQVNDHLGLELTYGNLGLNTLVRSYERPVSSRRSVTGKDVITGFGFNFDKSTFLLGVNYAF